MRMLPPACPPGAVCSSTAVRSPSDAPYTAGRQTGRSRADNHEVVHFCVERLANADRIGDLTVRRIAQRHQGAERHHGRVRFGDAELLQQAVDIGIGLEIHPGEENTILRQEVADAERIGGVARPDHAQTGEIGGTHGATGGAQ